jgi:hypothetical protein
MATLPERHVPERKVLKAAPERAGSREKAHRWAPGLC